MKTSKFCAYYLSENESLVGITSVLAPDIEAAAKRIEEELKKPGRQQYLTRWELSGRIVLPEGVSSLKGDN